MGDLNGEEFVELAIVRRIGVRWANEGALSMRGGRRET